MAKAIETVSVTIESDDNGTAEISVPEPLLELIEGNDTTGADAVANTALRHFANRVHDAVHHGEGTDNEAIIASDEAVMESFEQRFGMDYSEYHAH